MPASRASAPPSPPYDSDKPSAPVSIWGWDGGLVLGIFTVFLIVIILVLPKFIKSMMKTCKPTLPENAEGPADADVPSGLLAASPDSPGDSDDAGAHPESGRELLQSIRKRLTGNGGSSGSFHAAKSRTPGPSTSSGLMDSQERTSLVDASEMDSPIPASTPVLSRSRQAIYSACAAMMFNSSETHAEPVFSAARGALEVSAPGFPRA